VRRKAKEVSSVKLLKRTVPAKEKSEKLAAAAAAGERCVEAVGWALQLAQDKKFDKGLFDGLEHTTAAWRQATRDHGLRAAAKHLVADQSVHAELRNARKDLRQAYARVDTTRKGQRVAISLVGLTSLAGLAALAAPLVRERVSALIASASRTSADLQQRATANKSRNGGRPRTLEELTKENLYARAQEAEIPGRSEMSKEELIDALRAKG
jgi:hypothetical protein